MNKDLLICYLEKELTSMKSLQKKYDSKISYVDNSSTLKDFSSKVLTLLDYSFNDYPNNDNDSYFPRPEKLQSKPDYVKRLKELTSTKKGSSKSNMTNSLHNFLLFVFDLNRCNSYAISLLQSATKHKINKKMKQVCDTKLSYYVRTTENKNPIKHNADGSITIANFIHAEKGSKLNINHAKIITDDGMTTIDELHFSSENNGKLLLNGSEVDCVEWMSNCVNICEKLVERIKETNF